MLGGKSLEDKGQKEEEEVKVACRLKQKTGQEGSQAAGPL